MKLTFGTVCSGIECASLAVEPLGWRLRWMFEIDPFCSRFLAHKYRGIPNYGDITQNHQNATGTDVVIGGTPCQPFSITGDRKGMDDPRGRVTQSFVDLVGYARPKWIIWENVPGITSSQNGRGFVQFLGGLEKCGYLLAWRILDVSNWGIPQRRRRIFLVGHHRTPGAAVAALFDSGTMQEVAGSAKKIRQATVDLDAGGCFGWTGDETPKCCHEKTPTIRASQGGEGIGIAGHGIRPRRLSSVEMERLQGIPDNYTAFENATYSQRKKVIGNGFAIPVIRWIAERIEVVETILATQYR